MRPTTPEALLAVLVALSLTAAALYLQGGDEQDAPPGGPGWPDPLAQNLGELGGCEPRDEQGNIDYGAEFPPGCHNHANASQHNFSTENIELVGWNPLIEPGNGEVQVADSPDGRTYAYLAGWEGFTIVDVTDPSNPEVVGWYSDPDTQLIDVKYLEYDGREYIIAGNQIIDPKLDPSKDRTDDPSYLSLILVEVTDKTNPQFVDDWYDPDHPSGPHNNFAYKIDGEWYLFMGNPDYDECYELTGREACGGVTIIHLNFNVLPGFPRIVKVGEYEVDWENTRGGWIYIHDLTVQRWPGNDTSDPRFGRTFLYAAYWEAGLRIADVTDVPKPGDPDYPLNVLFGGILWRAPEVGYWMDFADLDGDGEPDMGQRGGDNDGRTSYIHYAEPYPELIEGRHVTVIAVETLQTSVGTGLVYILDTTGIDVDATTGNWRFVIEQLSYWENDFAEEHYIPGGQEWLLFSPHNFDLANGRIYLSHYHAGLWIIDISDEARLRDPATIGYYLPQAVDAPCDAGLDCFVPNLWAAEYYRGYIFLSGISTGLYVVQLADDKPYADL